MAMCVQPKRGTSQGPGGDSRRGLPEGTPSGPCALGRNAQETPPIGAHLESRACRSCRFFPEDFAAKGKCTGLS